MITRVAPPALSSPSSSISSAPVPLSRLPVGSSARTIAGSPTSARATATRWRSPPESLAAEWRSRWERPTRASAAAARSRRSAAGTPGVEQAVGDVVDHRRRLEQEEPLEDEADPGRPEPRQLVVARRRRRRDPRPRCWPLLGRSSVPIRCSSVDLPEPEGPTIAVSSPRRDAQRDPAQRLAPRPGRSCGRRAARAPAGELIRRSPLSCPRAAPCPRPRRSRRRRGRG